MLSGRKQLLFQRAIVDDVFDNVASKSELVHKGGCLGGRAEASNSFAFALDVLKEGHEFSADRIDPLGESGPSA